MARLIVLMAIGALLASCTASKVLTVGTAKAIVYKAEYKLNSRLTWIPRAAVYTRVELCNGNTVDVVGWNHLGEKLWVAATPEEAADCNVLIEWEQADG